jgi:hypothetical protein
VSEIGAGIVDRLILAYQATKLAADRPSARLQGGVGETLAGFNRGGRCATSRNRAARNGILMTDQAV